MYSPKINEKFIPKLYKLKQITGKPMTTLVTEALEMYLKNILGGDHEDPTKEEREKETAQSLY